MRRKQVMNNNISEPIIVRDPITNEYLDITALIKHKHRFEDKFNFSFNDTAKAIDKCIAFVAIECDFVNNLHFKNTIETLYNLKNTFQEMKELSKIE